VASRMSEHGGEQRTPLKGSVRVRSPNTAEQCSQMFVFAKKCSPDFLPSVVNSDAGMNEHVC
jgi:hypothetical protein